jgi:hypothetical protein
LGYVLGDSFTTSSGHPIRNGRACNKTILQKNWFPEFTLLCRGKTLLIRNSIFLLQVAAFSEKMKKGHFLQHFFSPKNRMPSFLFLFFPIGWKKN